MMNAAHVEAVLGHALSIAAQADSPRDRELGPIHLLKYLYLADLAFAKKRRGESFTGAKWQFYKFGPWAAEAFLAIEPSVEAIGATRRTFASQYREDNVRWSLQDRPDPKSVRLPRDVALVVAKAVRKFGADTSALLHHVYRTRPMLRAAPGEILELTPEAPRDTDRTHQADAPPVKLSKTKVKKLREGVRERIVRSRSARHFVEPDPPPRYDEIFTAGVAWLDGPEPEPVSGRLSFSNDVWHSRARGESELP